MCEERERLIGYVYDECDSAERQAIEEHLQTCPTCRREIGGLRNVRQDLLAWKVPDHESVWRPMAPPKGESLWQALPTWALAAAAALVLMAGAAGGAATYAFMPRGATDVRPAQSASAASSPAVNLVPASIGSTASDGVEQRIAALEQLVRAISTQSPADVRALRVKADALANQLQRLSSQQEDLSDAVIGAYSYAQDTRVKQSAIERRNNYIMTGLSPNEGPVGFGGGR